MYFLPQHIIKIIEDKQESGLTKTSILKEILNGKVNDQEYLKEDYDNRFENIVKSLYFGYQVDEFDNLKELGLFSNHYYQNDWDKYHETLMVFYYIDGDFTGSIWIPYTSKATYKANFSFNYKEERKSLGVSRYQELHLTPKWFQDLFDKADKYVSERNENNLNEIEENISLLIKEWNKKYRFSSGVNTNHPIYNKIISFKLNAISILLKYLQQEPNFLLLSALQDTAFVDIIPEEDAGKINKMADIWIQWGKEKGYII